jgi:hypothetical protein
VISAGVGVRDAGGFVVGPDEWRHLAHGAHAPALQQPQRGGKMGDVRPFGFRQGSIDQSKGDVINLGIGK